MSESTQKPAMDGVFRTALQDLSELAGRMAVLSDPLDRLGRRLLECWEARGKVLIAGNGGSAADAMHFAEELVVRFRRNRRALAAIALCDPTIITCAGNDFSFQSIFERQVEALGNPGDVFIAMTTSGNSENLVRAARFAGEQGLTTVSFLGKDGGKLRGACDIELLVPSDDTARIQEMHKLLFHTICHWVDDQV